MFAFRTNAPALKRHTGSRPFNNGHPALGGGGRAGDTATTKKNEAPKQRAILGQKTDTVATNVGNSSARDGNQADPLHRLTKDQRLSIITSNWDFASNSPCLVPPRIVCLYLCNLINTVSEV